MTTLAMPLSIPSCAISRRTFLAAVGAAVLPAAMDSAAATERPNILFILVDDMGWRDLGCYGSTFYETPQIDRLASEGVRFTNAYAAGPVCSPTRASILTGKYPARLHLTNWIGGSQVPAAYVEHLPLEEVTIGEAFREEGYRTGYIGKWHLGDEPEYNPDKQGFEHVVGNGGSMPRYFYPHRNFWRQEEPPTIHLSGGHEGQHLTDRLTDEALAFIETPSDEPFLLYLAYYAPHTPIEDKEELIEKYRKKAAALGLSPDPEFAPEPVGASTTRVAQNDPTYAAMIETLDTNIGRLLDKLDERDIAKNTIVVFVSDNGGLASYDARPTSNAPWRAGKAWLYEGGIRIPLIIRQPGNAARVCDESVISTDLFPTILDLADLPLHPDQHKDGLTLAPLLLGTDKLDRDALYWHYPHEYPSNVPASAIRKGEFKLLELFAEKRIELYNLKNDPGETRDLASKMPEKVQELYDNLNQWRESVGANRPVWKNTPDAA